MNTPYILITGASSELGYAVCELLSKDNRIILHGRNYEQLESLKNRLRNSQHHLVWSFDFSNIDELLPSLHGILNNDVRIESIIHIAGVYETMPLRLANHKSLMRSFNINLFSLIDIVAVLLKKEYREYLKSLVIVSTVSIHGSFGRGNVAYNVSKSALESYSKVLASELAPNVRVNCIAPGRLNTININQFDRAIIDKLKDQHPLGIGHVDDIANMIEYLISEKAKWITGQTFIIDGGSTCKIL